MVSVYDSAHALARAIRESDEAREMQRLKDIAEGDDTNRALLSEYKKIQAQLQLANMAGGQVDPEEMQRFSKIASLLFMNGDVEAYLLAEMRLQRLMADVFKIITEAGGLSLDLPGI